MRDVLLYTRTTLDGLRCEMGNQPQVRTQKTDQNFRETSTENWKREKQDRIVYESKRQPIELEHRVRGREQSTTKITTIVNVLKVRVQDQEEEHHEPTYHALQVDHQVRADLSYKVVSPPEEVLFSPPPSQVDLP